MAKILVASLCLGVASATPWPFSMWRSSEIEQASTKTAAAAGSIPKFPEFYHTTPQLAEAVKKLAGGCPGLSVETVKDSGIEIQVAKYLQPGHSKKFSTMVVANEHAREMIGGEIALNFLKALCGQAGAADIEESKKDTEFMIIVNANPHSRALVEKGEYCRRVNENEVDINRNFDVDWDRTDKDDLSTWPGEKAFDQPESRMIKDLMHKFQPHAYLDIHSGFRGMFFPNAVTNDQEFGSNLQRITANVDEAACKCPLGVANKEVGYHTSGSALDYSFEKVGVPFSMAVEVYLDPELISEVQHIESRWEEQKKNLLKPLKTGSSFMENGFSPVPMSFIQSADSAKVVDGLAPHECLRYFNPVTKEQFDKVINPWTNALASLSISSRNVHPNAAYDALKKKSTERVLKQATPVSQVQSQAPSQGEAPVWFAVKVLGLLAVVYVAIKYYKVKQSKSAEAAPFASQTAPVQISD